MSKKAEPLVTVGLTTYQRTQSFKKALRALAGQTYKNLEIIVSENYSPGFEAKEVFAKKLIKKDSRISYFRHKPNRGALFNAKFVIEKATGKYFMWGFDDDDYEPTFIAELVKKLENHPEAGVAMTAFKIFHQPDQAQVIRYTGKYNPNNKNLFQTFWGVLHSPRSKLYLFYCGLFRRELFLDAFEKLSDLYAMDRFFMIYFSLVANYQYVDKILYYKYLESPSQTKGEKSQLKTFSWYGEFLSIFQLAWAVFSSKRVPFLRKLYMPLGVIILLFRVLMHLLIEFLGIVIIAFKGILFVFQKMMYPIVKLQVALYEKYVWSKNE